MTITATFIDALHRLEESGNVDVIASLFAEDAALSNPLVIHDGTEEQTSKRFWKRYRDAFSDIESTFLNVVENGNAAAIEWQSEGVVDGQSVSYSGVSVLEFERDQIKAFRAYFDPRELVARTGTRDLDATPSDVESAP
jgi:ketosteroid isomerase-like protein